VRATRCRKKRREEKHGTYGKKNGIYGRRFGFRG
jgi:hypothetical protein